MSILLVTGSVTEDILLLFYVGHVLVCMPSLPVALHSEVDSSHHDSCCGNDAIKLIDSCEPRERWVDPVSDLDPVSNSEHLLISFGSCRGSLMSLLLVHLIETFNHFS